MTAVAAFDFYGGLTIAAVAGIWAVVDGLLGLRRNRRD